MYRGARSAVAALLLITAVVGVLPVAPASAAENEWFTSSGQPKADSINATMRSLVESFRWHLFGQSWDGADHPELPTHVGLTATGAPLSPWVTGTTFDQANTEATLRSLVQAFRWHFWGISWDGNPHPEIPTHASVVLPSQPIDPWFTDTGKPIPDNISATMKSLVEAFRWHFWGISWDGSLHPDIPTHAHGLSATVDYVVDGDTIDVLINGVSQRVRLIGVDTPEVYGEMECYGREASDFTKGRLDGQTVQLEKDVSETDVYGRLLRYVWVGDELFNETLVRQGYAMVDTFPPDVKYVDRFTAAQDSARAEGAGLWSRCDAS